MTYSISHTLIFTLVFILSLSISHSRNHYDVYRRSVPVYNRWTPFRSDSHHSYQQRSLRNYYQDPYMINFNHQPYRQQNQYLGNRDQPPKRYHGGNRNSYRKENSYQHENRYSHQNSYSNPQYRPPKTYKVENQYSNQYSHYKPQYEPSKSNDKKGRKPGLYTLVTDQDKYPAKATPEVKGTKKPMKKQCQHRHENQPSAFQPLDQSISHFHDFEDCDHYDHLNEEGMVDYTDTSSCSTKINFHGKYLVPSLDSKCPPMTYDESQRFCSSLNMKTLTIKSDEPNEDIDEKFMISCRVESKGYWTAGFIENHESRKVHWFDRLDTTESSLWGVGQPNGPNEFCVAVRKVGSSGRLFDETCNKKFHVVCEAPSQNSPPIPEFGNFEF